MARERLFKLVWTGLSLLVGMILGANVDAYLDTIGANQVLTRILGSNAEELASLASSLWFQFPSVAVIAFTLGLWVDSWLQRSAAKEPKLDRYQALGADAIKVARICRGAASSYVEHDASPEFAKLSSILIRLAKSGFPIPDLPEGLPANDALGISAHYLVSVGQLLLDGHRKEAMHVAQQLVSQEPGKELLNARSGRFGDRI